jgi:hypothetical protein
VLSHQADQVQEVGVQAEAVVQVSTEEMAQPVGIGEAIGERLALVRQAEPVEQEALLAVVPHLATAVTAVMLPR